MMCEKCGNVNCTCQPKANLNANKWVVEYEPPFSFRVKPFLETNAFTRWELRKYNSRYEAELGVFDSIREIAVQKVVAAAHLMAEVEVLTELAGGTLDKPQDD